MVTVGSGTATESAAHTVTPKTAIPASLIAGRVLRLSAFTPILQSSHDHKQLNDQKRRILRACTHAPTGTGSQRLRICTTGCSGGSHRRVFTHPFTKASHS